MKEKVFTLLPTMKTNERMGNVFNPDTYHFLSKDIYSYISHAEISGGIGKTQR